MSVKSPQDTLKAGQAAKDNLEAVKARIASMRVRLALSERSKDIEGLNQVRDQLDRSLEPRASKYVREAAERANEITAFREKRKAQASSRSQERSHNHSHS